jgi:integrase
MKRCCTKSFVRETDYSAGRVRRRRNQRARTEKRIAESSHERFPTFGEELALINHCNRPGLRGNTHLWAVLIVAADTGLRENEMFTLEKGDIDFRSGVIT